MYACSSCDVAGQIVSINILLRLLSLASVTTDAAGKSQYTLATKLNSTRSTLLLWCSTHWQQSWPYQQQSWPYQQKSWPYQQQSWLYWQQSPPWKAIKFKLLPKPATKSTIHRPQSRPHQQQWTLLPICCRFRQQFTFWLIYCQFRQQLPLLPICCQFRQQYTMLLICCQF